MQRAKTRMVPVYSPFNIASFFSIVPIVPVMKGGFFDDMVAGGDVVNGGKTVVEAVAGGKEAAEAMIAYLEKKGVK